MNNEQYISEIVANVIKSIGNEKSNEAPKTSMHKKGVFSSMSDALQAVDELMDEEGLFVGTSTGGCFKGLVNYINENNITNKTIVFISPDSGIKYLSKR